MKSIFYLLFASIQSLYAQEPGNTITIYGTPDTDSARKLIEQYDTVFIYSKYPLPENIITCDKISRWMYPSQLNDDYLHEERFDSIYHVVLFDHIVTRKMLNVFLPTLNNPNANLCDVSLTLKNPNTSQVVVFYDIFNWMNNNGKQIFNANREVHNVWGFNSGNIGFPVKLYHEPTGTDFTFGHAELKMIFKGLQ